MKTRKEKRRFIRQLIRSVANDLITDVQKMPSEWDGHELRELIAERFNRCRSLSDRCYFNNPSGMRADRKRLRAYRSECYNRNL